MPSAPVFTLEDGSGVIPFCVPTKFFMLVSSWRIKTSWPLEFRAAAIVYDLPFEGGWSDVTLIC